MMPDEIAAGSVPVYLNVLVIYAAALSLADGSGCGFHLPVASKRKTKLPWYSGSQTG
jgi:hypothetical protein